MDPKVLPEWLLCARSIAIVGYGREGKSTNRFLTTHGLGAKILIYQQHQDEFRLPAVDTIFKSPGIPLKKIAFEGKPYFTSQADLFTQLFGRQTIAVTGTKGKSTTAHAVNHVLNEVGKPCILVGNIGKPALDSVGSVNEEMMIVFEMSAFQTETLHVAPHISVFTSFYQDHLDYYESMTEYGQAKRHMFDLQTSEDICICQDIPPVQELLTTCSAKKIMYTDDSNLEPARIISSLFGVSTQKIDQAMKTIPPLSGRMEVIGIHKGITFIDDAVATIPEATIRAIKNTPNVKTLMVGGYDRHQQYEALAQAIADSQIENLILFPTTGDQIGKLAQALHSKIRLFPVNSMEEAVKIAYQHTQAGAVVLLSTGAPSFGLFKDYHDRSRQYKEWTLKLQ